METLEEDTTLHCDTRNRLFSLVCSVFRLLFFLPRLLSTTTAARFLRPELLFAVGVSLRFGVVICVWQLISSPCFA